MVVKIIAVVAVVVIVSWILSGVAQSKWQDWRTKKALDGEYGKPSQWATELIEEEDQLFILAVNSLPNMEMKEIGIIAESKEELRELTVERLEELATEPIPEEFAE